ncbi:MAG: tannase/feruloyl esterase family alpha/beta hydrolase [Acidobacteriota bacterium]|nr:tannase/feruloyl esterase family alpha/beta hydrolase [Acidobacteriota bacterium]
MHYVSRCGIIGAVALVSFVLDGLDGPAAAQNGSSFLDASTSAIDYRAPQVTVRRPATSCRSLLDLTGHDYAVVSATLVAAASDVPEHCRVFGVIRPEIGFGVHLPTGWNWRFYMQGNGGYAGNAPDAEGTLRTAMRAIANGFAAASTDTGHDARVEPLGTFAHNNLAKEIDYAFRAVHLTAVTAKAVIAAYYDTPQRYAYWDGCSTGGRQGLMSAQRFPGDFDGIVAGAPVQNFTDTQMAYIWNNQALARAPLTVAKVAQVGEAVYARCDGSDGLEDGLIDDPRQCDFDPARHLPVCDGSSGDDCFTNGEIETLQAIYGGPVADGRQLFPGQPVGAEAGGWTNWIISDRGPTIGSRFSETFFKYLAFTPDEPEFDWRTFDFATDPARVTGRTMLDAMDPDLSAFQARGGKMITHFGWADTALNPMMGVNYYEDVRATMGEEATTDFYRFFTVPGMFHCGGGLGTDTFDVMTPLVNWVEGGTPPDTIPASRVEGGAVTRTRPLCPYPQIVRYAGSGSINDASNFACVAPSR